MAIGEKKKQWKFVGDSRDTAPKIHTTDGAVE
jgi:hypothetical protein